MQKGRMAVGDTVYAKTGFGTMSRWFSRGTEFTIIAEHAAEGEYTATVDLREVLGERSKRKAEEIHGVARGDVTRSDAVVPTGRQGTYRRNGRWVRG